MKPVCQILLLLMPMFCRSQERTIDSLKRLLPTATTDSTRFRLTSNIASNYGYTHYDSALNYTNKALLLAQKNSKKISEAEALYRKGFLMNRLQRLTEAYRALTAALQIAEDVRNENSFWNIRKPQVKDENYRLQVLAGIHNALAIFLQNAGRTDQAVVQFKEAIKFSTLIGDLSAVALINGNLGYLYYRDLNEPDSALLLAKTAERIFLQMKEENRLGSVYAIMGVSYFKKHDDSLGLAYVRKAISIHKKYNSSSSLASTYRGLAKYYLQEKNKDSALYYSRMAANIHIPIYSMDLGDDFENIARSYELNNNLDSAYKYKKIALATYDSLYKNRIKGLIGFQQLSFDQQQQLQQLEAENIAARNRRRIYALLTGLGVILLIGFFLYRNNQQQKRANLLLQKQKEEIDNKNKELEIESALERVRSRSMEMQKSEELREVVQVIFDQLCGLNFKIESASFVVEMNETNDLKTWLAGSGKQYATRIDVPYLDHPIFNRLVEAKEKGEAFYTLLLTKEEKDRFFNHYFKFSPIPEERRLGIYNSNGLAQSTVLMKNIGLTIVNYAPLPYSDKQNKTLVRFGKAFEQVYTRFLDLQKAEAQAREAQTEAALERVRSRSMAMQKSEELREVIQVIFDELYGLHFNLDTASFAVEIDETNDLRNWVASPLAQYASRIDLPYIDHPIFNRLIEAKEKGEEFLTFLFNKEEKDRFFDHYFKFAIVSEERKSYVYNSRSWVGSSVLMKKITLGINNYSSIPYSDEENKTLVRFGKAFEQTYTRFLDLQKAEGNAKEAQRQASVDRVRAEIASMRTTKDLDRIIPLIWNELTTLHIPFIRCGVFIVNEDARQTQVYLSTPEGKSIAAFQLPFHSDGLNKEVLQHWRNNQIFKDHWNADTFLEWTQSLIEAGAIQPNERYSNEQPPGNLYLHFVPFRQGMLYVGNTQPLSADELSLIESLADAFSTAYARYEDFGKLEMAKQQIEITLTELKSAQSQLIQSEKMASLGELTAGIAHEIQNPLNFVNNFSDVNVELLEELKSELLADNKDEAIAIAGNIKENEQKINHHGKRADAIVKGMLQHSRANGGKKELTDINALADEYLRLSYHGLRAKDKGFNADFKTEFAQNIGMLELVPQDIGRVLLNLFNNAFYATYEKKRQINGTFEPTVTVTTKRTATGVEILVKDNGNGVPLEVVDKIFQPFFTTKPTGEGTGLGLSLSYDIIKAHGGEIRVATKDGEGSEFTIQLPAIN